MKQDLSDKVKKHHFTKSISDLTHQSKDIVKTTHEMTTKFRKLPWHKLPAIGWFYIIFIVVIMIIVGAFIVPYISF
jgi:hypothetical protein